MLDNEMLDDEVAAIGVDDDEVVKLEFEEMHKTFVYDEMVQIDAIQTSPVLMCGIDEDDEVEVLVIAHTELDEADDELWHQLVIDDEVDDDNIDAIVIIDMIDVNEYSSFVILQLADMM